MPNTTFDITKSADAIIRNHKLGAASVMTEARDLAKARPHHSFITFARVSEHTGRTIVFNVTRTDTGVRIGYNRIF